MGNVCKFCGAALMVRWCQDPWCSRFLGVPVANGQDFDRFYLEHKGKFSQLPDSDLCDECGGMLAIGSLTNPCPECLKDEPATALKRFEDKDRDALEAELGYAGDVKWRTFHEDAGLVVGDEWEGYTLELLGIELAERYSDCVIPTEGLAVYESLGLAREAESGLLVKQLFPFTCIPDEANPDLIIELCRIRARYKGSPLYSEMRAHPIGVRRVGIHGFEYKHTAQQLERAVQGLDLIRAQAKKLGRPKGTRYYPKSEFRKQSVNFYRKYFAENNQHPKDIDIAEAIGLSRSAFYGHLTAYDMQIQDIRAEAMEIKDPPSSPSPK